MTNQTVTHSRLTGYIVGVNDALSSNRKVDGSRLTDSTQALNDMGTMTLVMELRRRAIKDPSLSQGRTTPKECLYDSGLISLQYRAS